MNKVYTTTVTLLLDTASAYTLKELETALEGAMYAACTELEQNKISPTFKIEELKEI